MSPGKVLAVTLALFPLFFAFGQDRPGPEQVMKAFVTAYPGAVERAEYRNGDWAVLMRGKWFYYADGRLLPEEHRSQAESWARQSFYGYFPDLPPWKEPEGEQAERLKNVLANRRANPPKRDPEFYDTLWRAHTRNEAAANPEWYKIPYSGRWHPPLSVVRIFERYGFCWGGKWPLFDTMHFEYRPEILILYGMKVENP
ncbi:MAG: M15 family metallopeptidase [Treponema sp.]|jgi:hypothetical protein|nr:M15 family metallopeptidase [Treponema sp.]